MRTAKRALAVVCLLAFSLVAFAVPAAAVTSFPGQPLPYLSSLNSNTYQDAFYAFTTGYGDQYYYSVPRSDYQTVIFSVGSVIYGASLTSSSVSYLSTYNYSSTNVNLSTLDDSTGLYYNQINIQNIQYSNLTNFSTLADGLAAASYFFAHYGDPEIVVVAPSGSYTWLTGAGFTNNSDVDVATAAYSGGGDNVTVIASFESNLVLPGTRNGTSRNYVLNQIDSTTGLYFVASISQEPVDSSVPMFGTLDELLAAAAAALSESDNPGGSGGYSPTVAEFDLDPGNVAFIIMSDLTQPINLSATFYRNSALIPSYGSYWPGNQLYKFGASYPSAGTTLPGAGADQIPWTKNEWGQTNLVGQTKYAVATLTASSNMVMIYNPYNSADDTGSSYGAGTVNPSIKVMSQGFSRNGVRIYHLKDTFSVVDPDAYWGIVSSSPENWDDFYQSTNDPTADNPDVTGWTNKDGDPTPAPGSSPYNEAPQQQGIADILSGFISNITSLFTEGHDAIRNLSENASQFVSRLSSLYAWLPPQVFSVLTSAIILAIIVGVLKVFL